MILHIDDGGRECSHSSFNTLFGCHFPEIGISVEPAYPDKQVTSILSYLRHIRYTGGERFWPYPKHWPQILQIRLQPQS